MRGEGTEENMWEWDAEVGEGTERESKERDILIEGAIIKLGTNLVLGKLPGTHKDEL